tara:strand:+ start:342 stop:821 length:480 start_codon:yes stop_codon:yes gene_type:complete
MKPYSKEFKSLLVEKCLLEKNTSIRSAALEAGIAKSTLHDWIKNFKNNNPGSTKTPSYTWNNKDKQRAIIETKGLNEVSLGEYCRSHGIYKSQLDKWRVDLMSKNKTNNLALKTEKALCQKIEDLEKALKHSEMALSEVTALLELKKKVDEVLKENKAD